MQSILRCCRRYLRRRRAADFRADAVWYSPRSSRRSIITSSLVRRLDGRRSLLSFILEPFRLFFSLGTATRRTAYFRAVFLLQLSTCETLRLLHFPGLQASTTLQTGHKRRPVSFLETVSRSANKQPVAGVVAWFASTSSTLCG
jgi:hypothetical protein